MDNYHESKLRMYLTVDNLLLTYDSITATLPGFVENRKIFSSAVPKIQAYNAECLTNRKGVIDNKGDLRVEVTVMADDNARKLGSFALLTNNIKLKQEVRITESKLNRVPDSDVRDYAQIVYDKGQMYLSQLGDYCINKTTQEAFLNVITLYNSVLGTPGASRTMSKSNRRQMLSWFSVADRALKKMDAGVEIIKLIEPEFYMIYKDARKIHLIGKGSLTLKGLVLDAHSGTPLSGVRLIFSLADPGNGVAPAEELEKRTFRKGGFRIKSMVPGMYTVKVSRIGYHDHQLTVAVDGEKMVDLKVRLEKLA